MPRLTWLMKRVTESHGKLRPFPEGEPDFEYISKQYPLKLLASAMDDRRDRMDTSRRHVQTGAASESTVTLASKPAHLPGHLEADVNDSDSSSSGEDQALEITAPPSSRVMACCSTVSFFAAATSAADRGNSVFYNNLIRILFFVRIRLPQALQEVQAS